MMMDGKDVENTTCVAHRWLFRYSGMRLRAMDLILAIAELQYAIVYTDVIHNFSKTP